MLFRSWTCSPPNRSRPAESPSTYRPWPEGGRFPRDGSQIGLVPIQRQAHPGCQGGAPQTAARSPSFFLEKKFVFLCESTAVFLLGKSHGQRNLAGSSPWDPKEGDTTEHTHMHTDSPMNVCYSQARKGAQKILNCRSQKWVSV